MSELTRAHKELCEKIAGEFAAANYHTSATAWTALATRIGYVLDGAYARFTNTDVAAIASLHTSGLRHGISLERSRMLSQMGVAVIERAWNINPENK